MTTVFADTFYFLALLDSREERHLPAAEVSRDPQFRILKPSPATNISSRRVSPH
jgi:hypothetical protein